jgi:hypothetical protein
MGSVEFSRWNFNGDSTRLGVLKNRVLRGIFGPKRDKVTRKWRKLHHEELSDLYSLSNIFRVMKSRRMWWAGHVTRMGIVEVYTRFWWGNPRQRHHLADGGVDGRLILRWIFRMWDVRTWTGLIWLRIGTGGGLL